MRVVFRNIEVPVNSSLTDTHEVEYTGEGFTITYPEYSVRPLDAQDIVAANEEMVAIIKENGDIPMISYCLYDVTDGLQNEYRFRICEVTPDRIFIRAFGSHDDHPLKYDPNDHPTVQFLNAVRRSGLCSEVELDNGAPPQLSIILTPEASQSTIHRSMAHEAILRLFPDRAA